ncbi:MAG: hypothetical protein IIY88_03685 [Eubacterium sp.]|nr:hypothetical protein [Eubacterium sp.]
MMKKVKKILTFGLACTMILVLAACESLIPAPVIPPDEASGTEESAESSAEGNMNMPNPWVECVTLEEAVKLAGFNMEVPAMIEGYSSNMIQAMKGEMIQVFYYAGDPDDEESANVLIRKGKGTDDISGDYNSYSEEKTLSLHGVDVYVGGVDGLIYKSTWTQDGYAYSITGDTGIALAMIDSLVETVK